LESENAADCFCGWAVSRTAGPDIVIVSSRWGYLPANLPKKSKIVRERLQLRRPGRAQGRLDAPLSFVP
jgi:hypothetical protein